MRNVMPRLMRQKRGSVVLFPDRRGVDRASQSRIDRDGDQLRAARDPSERGRAGADANRFV
jgi:hypothetical protein